MLAEAYPHGDVTNIVIHVLARAIDLLDEVADGAPPLDTPQARRAWVDALQSAFDAHVARRAAGEHGFLGDHALASAAAYFAVASEAYFANPHTFARELPAVYAVFSTYYAIDLAPRHVASSTPYRTV